MSGETTRDREPCAAIRELVAWYATGTLEEAEARSVEDHLAACTACAKLLSFSRDLKKGFAGIGESHPRPELLVDFAEGAERLEAANRAAIDRHLDGCESCTRVVAILGAVDEPEGGSAVKARRPAPGWVRSLWGELAASILRPAPAAVYLTVAVAAVVLLFARPGERFGDGRPGGDVPGIGTIAGGVVLLPDRTESGRGGVPSDEAIPAIGADHVQFLLLEFMELEEAPEGDAPYRVSFVREGEGRPAWETVVSGSVFAETLSLCILLDAGTLRPGLYAIDVTGPSGATIYRSALEVR